MSPQKIKDLLTNQSGLKGLSQLSSDLRDIYRKSKKGHKLAQLTIEILAYQLSKQIGAYAAAMNGLDAIVFTGGIGENAFYVRAKACQYLKFLTLKLDPKKNLANSQKISTPKSRIQVFVIATDEEKQIAVEVKNQLLT